jgi:Uma2 family endonuclease
MSTVIADRVYTPEDLLAMKDAVAYELVDGKLVKRHMGTESSEIAARILIMLGIFLGSHRVGRLFGSDASYQCFAGAPRKVRRADVGFVRFDRLPGGRAPKSHCPVAPDLAVEVVSPKDTGEEIESKVAEWVGAGVPLLWVVYPSTRTVRVHRPRTSPAGPVSDLKDADTLTGEEVLPGFSCKVSQIFDDAAA